MKTSQETNKIIPALFALKEDIKGVAKNATNPFYKSEYVDLNDLIQELDPLLAKHKLMLLQPGDNGCVESVIMHESGQFASSSFQLSGNPDAQKRMGEVTYLRRYSLMSFLGFRSIDDDGNVASGKADSFKKVDKKEPEVKPSVTLTTNVTTKEKEKLSFRNKTKPVVVDNDDI